MRAKRKSYRDEEYDRLRRLNLCTRCKCQDERTKNGGALCARCLMEKRKKNNEGGQTKLCL